MPRFQDQYSRYARPYARDAGPYSKKRSRGKFSRAPGQNFQSHVRKALLKTSETKYRIGTSEDVSLYHDRGEAAAGATATTQGAILWNPWDNISRGTAPGNRIADEIYPIGMALRLMYWCAADRQAQFVRIIVASVPRVNTYPGGGGQVVSTSGSYDLMDPSGSNDTVTGMIKSSDSGIKVLYDKMWTGTARGKTEDVDERGDNRFFKKIYIRAKKGSKLTWQTDGYLSNNPIGVWVIPYDDYATLRTDKLGWCSFTYKLYFKDP